MTQRHTGYIVTLAEDIREDDAEAVIGALRMVRGVVAVTPLVLTSEAAVASVATDIRVRTRVLEAVQDALFPQKESRR